MFLVKKGTNLGRDFGLNNVADTFGVVIKEIASDEILELFDDGDGCDDHSVF